MTSAHLEKLALDILAGVSEGTITGIACTVFSSDSTISTRCALGDNSPIFALGAVHLMLDDLKQEIESESSGRMNLQ